MKNSIKMREQNTGRLRTLMMVEKERMPRRQEGIGILVKMLAKIFVRISTHGAFLSCSILKGFLFLPIQGSLDSFLRTPSYKNIYGTCLKNVE